MNTYIFDDETRQAEWNSVAPHPLVSWEWGVARQKMGIDVLRIAQEDENGLRAVFQITFHKIPHTPLTVGYMPRTLIPNEDAILLLKQEAKKRNSICIKIEPYVEKNSCNKNDGHILSKFFIKSPHPLFPEWTQMLDLSLSEDELLSRMKPKWRYNIKLAQKKGVEIREETDEKGFDEFSKLYFKTTERQDYKGHNKKYHATIFNTLKESMGHILIAYYESQPLSAFHLFLFNETLYYPYGGSSEEYKNVMASNLLMWEAIRFGKGHGAKKFDMWGSLPPTYETESAGWAGFTRFKEGFGTEFVQFVGSYDLVLHPLLYQLYNAAYTVRKKLL